MSDISAAMVDALLEAYDFSPIHLLADIGGGHGMLLSEILKRYSGMQGVVFDLPNVVAGAPALADSQLDGRLSFEAGSFFERVSSGCDAYLMKFILHDWSDDSPPMAKFLDIEMLAMTAGGRERTTEEFSQLFAAAGLRLIRVIPTNGPLFILEAVCT